MTTACTVSSTAYPNPTLELINASRTSLHTDLELSVPLPAQFEWGQQGLRQDTVIQARLVGPQHAPVILVLGGISANRHVCDLSGPGNRQTGWWQGVTGPDCPIDTRRFRVLSFDFLPGDFLSDEGSSLEPDLCVTPGDQARIAAFLCDYLRIEKLHAFVGASYGGMIALNFARLFPEKLERLVILCAAHRVHPMGVAWRSIQRKIVQLGLDTQQPERALSLARELGMTTYRTSQEFGSRFLNHHDVQSYLENRGQEFIGKMSPARYLALSKSIDQHQVDPAEVQVPTTVIGFRQDQLVPVEDLRLLGQQLPQLAHYFEADSIYGHDAFLKEIPFLSDCLQQALNSALNSHMSQGMI